MRTDLAAFSIRFTNTCCSRMPSARTITGSLATIRWKSTGSLNFGRQTSTAAEDFRQRNFAKFELKLARAESRGIE